MLDGLMYALSTPFWGWALDCGLVSSHQSLFIGSLCIVVGYSFLGSSPSSIFLPGNIYIVGIGMAINGIGMASNLLTTYMLMVSSCYESGFVQDTEQTQGMLTSLWYCFYSLGGYFGSIIGGWAHDKMGFSNSTLIIVGIHFVSLISLCTMWFAERSQRKEAKEGYLPLKDLG